jgi:hypothetical protein
MKKQFIGLPADVTVNDIGPASEVKSYTLVEDALELPPDTALTRKWRTMATLAVILIVHGTCLMPLVDAHVVRIHAVCESVRHFVTQ